MEWDANVPGQTFYHPYLSLEKVENRIIDVDIKNVTEALKENTSISPVALAERVHNHYIGASFFRGHIISHLLFFMCNCLRYNSPDQTCLRRKI